MGFALHPLAFVDVSVIVDQASMTMGDVVEPKAFVLRAISEEQDSQTTSFVVRVPLPLVVGTVDHFAGTLLDQG
jgi:hypothetical protein